MRDYGGGGGGVIGGAKKFSFLWLSIPREDCQNICLMS